MPRNTSEHILNTAANLLGFCLVILTSLRINNHSELTFIDTTAAFISLFLVGACILSFLSIQSGQEKRSIPLERFANYFFLLSLIGILGLNILLIGIYTPFGRVVSNF